MKILKKVLYTILEALALIGLIAGLVFAFQFARANFLPSSGNSQAAYPPPEATQVYTPFPTYTPIPTRTPTPTPIVLDNGWYLYVDKEAGYSFSYPPDTHLSVGQSVGDVYKMVSIEFDMPEIHEYQGMLLIVRPNPKQMPLDEFLAQYYEEVAHKSLPVDSSAQIEQITVAGRLALKTTLISSLPSSSYAYQILVSNSDKVYVMGPTFGLLSGNKVYPETIELFQKILDTFKINP